MVALLWSLFLYREIKYYGIGVRIEGYYPGPCRILQWNGPCFPSLPATLCRACALVKGFHFCSQWDRTNNKLSFTATVVFELPPALKKQGIKQHHDENTWNEIQKAYTLTKCWQCSLKWMKCQLWMKHDMSVFLISQKLKGHLSVKILVYTANRVRKKQTYEKEMATITHPSIARNCTLMCFVIVWISN